MTARKPFRSYAITVAATKVCIVAACFALNLLVDPYGIFRIIEQPGINLTKPRASQNTEAFKYRSIDFTLPKTLLLGNSRVEMGLDPSRLPQGYTPAANAAIPGRGLGAMIDLADHAWLRSKPDTLLIGLEFFDCLTKESSASVLDVRRSPWSAHQPTTAGMFAKTRAIIVNLATLDATIDTLITLVSQTDAYTPHLEPSGFQPAREYTLIQRIDGPRTLFLQKDLENARMRARGGRSIFHADGTSSVCFAELERLLDDANLRHQRVYLMTYPYHARLLELITRAHLWDAYEQWKSRLTVLTASKRASGLKVSLRDFGGYHSYATEPIPEAGQRKPVPAWYWESGHFRAELGAKMLSVLLEASPQDGLFGVALTPETLSAHLANVRESRARFEMEQPRAVAEVARIVAETHVP